MSEAYSLEEVHKESNNKIFAMFMQCCKRSVTRGTEEDRQDLTLGVVRCAMHFIDLHCLLAGGGFALALNWG